MDPRPEDDVNDPLARQSDLAAVEARLGFVAKTRVRRVIAGWAGLLVLDLVTFFVALAVLNKQQDTIDSLHAGVCRNSGILVDGLNQQLAQTQNRKLYAQFFPQIPKEQLDRVIAKQVLQIDQQIAQLSGGCSISSLKGASVTPPTSSQNSEQK